MVRLVKWRLGIKRKRHRAYTIDSFIDSCRHVVMTHVFPGVITRSTSLTFIKLNITQATINDKKYIDLQLRVAQLKIANLPLKFPIILQVSLVLIYYNNV